MEVCEGEKGLYEAFGAFREYFFLFWLIGLSDLYQYEYGVEEGGDLEEGIEDSTSVARVCGKKGGNICSGLT